MSPPVQVSTAEPGTPYMSSVLHSAPQKHPGGLLITHSVSTSSLCEPSPVTGGGEPSRQRAGPSPYPRGALIWSNMVAISHLWLITLKLNKIKNSAPQLHWPHFKSPIATGTQWPTEAAMSDGAELRPVGQPGAGTFDFRPSWLGLGSATAHACLEGSWGNSQQ